MHCVKDAPNNTRFRRICKTFIPRPAARRLPITLLKVNKGEKTVHRRPRLKFDARQKSDTRGALGFGLFIPASPLLSNEGGDAGMNIHSK